MKSNQYLRLAIVFGIAIAGIFVFLPKRDAIGLSAVVAAMLATILIAQLSAPKAFILRNPRNITIGGWTLAGLGLVVSFILGWKSDQSAIVPGMMLSVIGVALTTLPRSLKAVEDAKARGATPTKDFSATGDVGAALQLLFREPAALGRSVGPWFALFCLLPIALIGMADWKPATRGGAELELLALLVFFLALICLPLVASIRWARYLARGEIPSLLSIPIGPLWGFLWRLFFTGVLFRIVSSSSSWLHTQLPSAPAWVVSALSQLAGLAVLVVASPWAMTFVMVATGAKNKSTAVALQAARGVGRRFYLGMLLILAPMAGFSWLLDLVPAKPKGQPVTAADFAQYGSWALILFFTFIVATTYLTRIYVRSSAGQAELATNGASSTA